MRRTALFICTALLLTIMAACTTSPTPTATAEIIPVNTSTHSAQLPTLTAAVPTSSATATAVPNTATAAPQYAVLQTGVNLRVGPGMLFDILNAYDEGQKVLVLGQAPAGDWYQVQTPDMRTGWMRSAVLTLDGLAMDLPVITPTGVLTIRGHVYAPNKNPASHIGVSLLNENSNTSPQKDTGNTDAFGEWYIYLPTDMAGEWTLRVDIYDCESNTVNSGCTLIGQFPPAQTVTLPLPEGTWIDFQMLP